MRVFLVLLMLTLLPLPFSAAASVACIDHALTEQSPHTRHHLPAQWQSVDSGPDVVANTSSHGVECSTCQGLGLAAMATPHRVQFSPARAVRIEPRTKFMSQPYHEPPYRPNWTAPLGLGLRAPV